MFNQVILIGNVGKDPEIRSMQNGDKVANFSLATSERWKNRAGERQEATEWHKVVVFGPLAEIVESYVDKGSKIQVVGKVKTRKWEDQSGTARYSTEIVLSGPQAGLTLLGDKQKAGNEDEAEEQRERSSRSSSSRSSGRSNGSSRGGGQRRQEPAATGDDLDDEIPF